ncbi:hypothetical protein [Streptomyces ferrugineus]
MTSPGRGRRQSAYRILVATTPDRLTPSRADVWNSGRVTHPPRSPCATSSGGPPGPRTPIARPS